MLNYFRRFSDLKTELENNPLVVVQNFTIEEGISNANISMVEQELDIIIPESLKEFYREVSSVEFVWTLKDGSKVPLMDNDEYGNVHGKAYIPDLYTAIDGMGDLTGADAWKNIFWFPDTMDENALEENKKVRPFDFFDNYGGECICMIAEKPNKLSKELYLRNKEGKILQTALTIEQYVDMLITSKGFVNFQVAFLGKSHERSKLTYYLPKIFPVQE